MLYRVQARRQELLAKGHVISDEDVRVLETEGLDTIWVTELEEGEIGEDEAVSAVAAIMGCGSLEIRLAAGGRREPARHRELLRAGGRRVAEADQLRRQRGDCHFAKLQLCPAVGQRIATVKSAPFAVAKDHLEAILTILKERGPILQARPIRTPAVGAPYADPAQRRASATVI